MFECVNKVRFAYVQWLCLISWFSTPYSTYDLWIMRHALYHCSTPLAQVKQSSMLLPNPVFGRAVISRVIFRHRHRLILFPDLLYINFGALKISLRIYFLSIRPIFIDHPMTGVPLLILDPFSSVLSALSKKSYF